MNKAGKACIIGDVNSLSYMLSLIIPEEYRAKFREDMKSGKKISILRCDNSFEIAHKENGCIQYRTASMPYGVELFPHDDKYNWKTDEYDYILFLFSWPFNAKKQLDRIGQVNVYINNCFGSARFKAVLYNDENQRTAFSDIETRKDTLDKARQIIAEKLKELKLVELVECVAVNKSDDFELLFSGEDYGLAGVNIITDKKIRNFSSKIDDFCFETYVIFMSDMVNNRFGVEFLDEITKYEMVGNTENLYFKYWNNLRNSSVWSKFCDDLKNLYMETISPICIWDMEKDAVRLISLIISRAKYDIFETAPKIGFCGKDLDYRLDETVKKCKSQFKTKVNSFITTTVPDIITEELKAKEKLYFPDQNTGKQHRRT